MLLFARGGELNPVELAPGAVVADIMPMLRRVLSPGIDLTLEQETPAPRAEVDRMELEQGLMNLVVNARDAIDGSGTITVTVSTRGLPVGDARARGLAAGRYVIVAVEDDGEGMDAELQARVFTPFFTTKEAGEGTGLGLAAVDRVARQAGGFVRLESEPGVGTTFEIWLPAL
jgi:signal transduction histidine kinase